MFCKGKCMYSQCFDVLKIAFLWFMIDKLLLQGGGSCFGLWPREPRWRLLFDLFFLYFLSGGSCCTSWTARFWFQWGLACWLSARMLSDWNSTRNVNIASVQDMYACVPICVCVCLAAGSIHPSGVHVLESKTGRWLIHLVSCLWFSYLWIHQ
jgi:hypothetical protein